MNFLDGSWTPDPERARTSRAQRLLVRVLLSLRSEARSRPLSTHDRARAERLADRIMLELPRSVLPIGIAAAFIVGVVCLMPLVRDALPAGAEGRAAPVASVVEHGIRSQGAALSDGIQALREVVAPFAADEVPLQEVETDEEAPPSEAAAHFCRS